MTARDLQKAFAAVSPDCRREAHKTADTARKRSGVRRVILKITVGLAATAAVFGGLLAAGVRLAKNDGVTVQKVQYPVEIVTGTDSSGEQNVQEILSGETEYNPPIENPGKLTEGVTDGSFLYVINHNAHDQYEVAFSAPADRAVIYSFSTVPSKGTVTASVKTVCNAPFADSIAEMQFSSDSGSSASCAPLRVTVEAGQTCYLYLLASEPQTTGTVHFTVTDAGQPAEPAQEVEIPAGLQASLDEFYEAVNERVREDIYLMARSDYVEMDDTEALRKLADETAVPYFQTYLALAELKNDHLLARYMVKYVMHLYKTWREAPLDNPTMRQKGGDLRYHALYLQEASEAVRAAGDGITAEQCAELQTHYGYLIAAALQDAGKLSLLQIDAESPCQDPEQLAAFARCFE